MINAKITGDIGWHDAEYLKFKDYINISHNCFFIDNDAKYNVCVLVEPPSIVEASINDLKKFDLVLTWRKEILELLDNSRKFILGISWLEHDKMTFNKKNKISYLISSKMFTVGHYLRHMVFDKIYNIKEFNDLRLTAIKTPPRINSKNEILDEYKFSIIIENEKMENYITEKIIDCFASKTVPIYWGCKNINDYFDGLGIIKFNSLEDLMSKLSKIKSEDYDKMIPHINNNYKIAKKYYGYWQRISNEINSYFYEDKNANI